MVTNGSMKKWVTQYWWMVMKLTEGAPVLNGTWVDLLRCVQLYDYTFWLSQLHEFYVTENVWDVTWILHGREGKEQEIQTIAKIFFIPTSLRYVSLKPHWLNLSKLLFSHLAKMMIILVPFVTWLNSKALKDHQMCFPWLYLCFQPFLSYYGQSANIDMKVTS